MSTHYRESSSEQSSVHTPPSIIDCYSNNKKLFRHLLHGLAHELNNPVGAMVQSLDNIVRRMDPQNPKNQELARVHNVDLLQLQAYLQSRDIGRFIDNIRESAARISGLLSYLNSLHSQADPSLIQWVDLRCMTESHCKREQWEEAVCRIEGLSPGFPVCMGLYVQACAQDLALVIRHLLQNAWEAASASERPPRLIVRMGEESHAAVWRVEDNGLGLDAHTQAHMFDPFFTTKVGGVGRGLGLWICENIVTAYGGCMHVSTRPEGGSCVGFRLPVVEEQAG